MKILGTCANCDRDLLLDQMLEPGTGGACPWCGAMLAPGYTELFIPAIREAEAAGRALTGAVTRLRQTGRGLRIDPESVLGPLREALGLSGRDERMSERLRLAA